MPHLSRDGWWRLLWVLVPGLLALLLYWPALTHGWRSDDYLLVYYLDRDAECVRWGRVWEEWVRPWFGVRDLYRPLASLTYGLNWSLSRAPFGMHLTNVLIHAGTACCVALTAARLARSRGAFAAVVAGSVVALHPAGVESTAWIVARTSSMQVLWSAAAMWSFLRWRQGQGSQWVTLLLVGLAFTTREGGVLVPLSLLAMDGLAGTRPTWRAHLPHWLLVLGYLLWRRYLLGQFTTAEEGHSLLSRVGNGLGLLQQLLLPPTGDHPLGSFGLLPLLLLALFAATKWARSLLLCVPWALLLLLPGATHLAWTDGVLLGRFLVEGMPALALFCGLAVAAMPEAWRWGRVLACAALLAWLPSQQAWLAHYSEEDQQIRQVERALAAATADVDPKAPIGVATLPGQPPLQPGLWGFLLQRPYAAQDRCLVGAYGLLEADPANQALFADGAVVHSLVQQGGGFLTWNATQRALAAVASSDGVVELVRSAADPCVFTLPAGGSPTALQAIEVTGVAELHVAPFPELPAFPWRQSVVSPDGVGSLWCDTSSMVSWYITTQLGLGPPSLRLTTQNQAALPAQAAVRAHARLHPRAEPTPQLQDGSAAAFATALVPPAWQELRLYVLSPLGVLVADCASPRQLAACRERIQRHLPFVADVLGGCRVHWFWRGREQGMPVTTALRHTKLLPQ